MAIHRTARKVCTAAGMGFYLATHVFPALAPATFGGFWARLWAVFSSLVPCVKREVSQTATRHTVAGRNGVAVPRGGKVRA
jgi:hypothetical protein